MRRALAGLALAVACGASRPKGHSLFSSEALAPPDAPCLAWCHDAVPETSWAERCSRPEGHCRGCSECATGPADKQTDRPRRTEKRAAKRARRKAAEAETVAAKRARRKAKHGLRVIVMFTDREMPCGQAAREQLQAYAERANATLRVTTKRHDAVFSKLPGGKLGPGETNSRFAKLWLAGEALREGASHVALFDDTVLVNGRTVDLFALAEAAGQKHIVGQLEDRYLSQSLCDEYEVERCNTSTPMVNSGLVVFSQQHLPLFDDPLMGSEFRHREKVATSQLRQTAQPWEPGGKECFEIGGANFCDQALLNALLQRHATPVLDLNRNSPGCSHSSSADFGEGKALDVSQRDTLLGRSTCRVAVGSVLRRLYNKKENMHTQEGNLDLKKAARGLCFAHVTRGAGETRDKLLCDLGEMLRCEAA